MVVLIFDVGDKTGYIDKNAYEYIVSKYPRREWSMTKNYLALKYKNITRYIHRLVLEANEIKIPDKKEGDHINGDSLDNRLENLRVVSKSINNHNRRKREKSLTKYTGVGFHRKNNKYVAKININKKETYLGSYDTELEAAYAYDFAKKKLLKDNDLTYNNVAHLLDNKTKDAIELKVLQKIE